MTIFNFVAVYFPNLVFLLGVLQSGTTIVDQMDLLNEQVKMLAGDVALCTSSLKRLTEQASNNPDNKQIQVHLVKIL